LKEVLDADMADVIVEKTKSREDERLRGTIKDILTEILDKRRPSGPETRGPARDPRERDDHCQHHRERHHDDFNQDWRLGKGKGKCKGSTGCHTITQSQGSGNGRLRGSWQLFTRAKLHLYTRAQLHLYTRLHLYINAEPTCIPGTCPAGI
jgi:hypothetical protein